MADKEFDHVIVGGGIAGLYCAYHLSRLFEKEPKNIALFESTDRLGGRIETWRIDAESVAGENSNIVKVCDLINWDTEFRAANKMIKDLEASNDANKDQQIEEQHRKIRRLEKERDKKDLLMAEFGPMRFEPDHQPYLRKLFEDLKINDPKLGEENWSDLVSFPPYQSPPPDQPEFRLEGEEAEQQNLVDLLLLALRRVFEVIEFEDTNNVKSKTYIKNNEPWKRNKPWWTVDPTQLPDYQAGVPFDEANFVWQEFRETRHLNQRFWKRNLMQWIKLLDEPDYRYIYDHTAFRKIPLSDIAFWNVLSSVLSHMAVTKLRDWASFYHLLPENPSAAAWIVFWLRNIKTSDSLKGIRGGTDLIVHLLCGELKFDPGKLESKDRHYVTYKNNDQRPPCSPELHLGHRLIEVEQKEEKGNWSTFLTFETDAKRLTVEVTGHVILALPKAALENVKFVCYPNDKVNDSLRALFDSVISIPLLKCFFVVEKPFWPASRGANVYAHTAPTRELHYKINKRGNIGLMMIYTDRPALNYWSDLNWPNFRENYDQNPRLRQPGLALPDMGKTFVVRNRYQAHAKIWNWTEGPPYDGWKNQKFENDRLLRTFLYYAKEEGAEDVTAARLVTAGMHDWGLKPHENACHGWRAGSDAASIIDYFSAFSLGLQGGDSRKTLHICGEAYSDYQAFMEGALRSAALALAQIYGALGAPFDMGNFTIAENVLRTGDYRIRTE